MRTTRRGVAAILISLVVAFALAGCGLSMPSDPSGTLDRVRDGELRAGVSPNGDFVDVEGGQPRGSEVDAIEEFAASLGAEVTWTIGSEEALVRGLENEELDIVAGGLTDRTPWTDKAGVTRPYAEAVGGDGRTHKIVMLVPIGENAFLSALETFLSERADAEAGA